VKWYGSGTVQAGSPAPPSPSLGVALGNKVSSIGNIKHGYQPTVTIIIRHKLIFTALSRGMPAGTENMHDDEQIDKHKPIQTENGGRSKPGCGSRIDPPEEPKEAIPIDHCKEDDKSSIGKQSYHEEDRRERKKWRHTSVTYQSYLVRKLLLLS
jgi:hypothetical protein